MPFPISLSAFPSLPLMLLFFRGLKWMVFLRKSAADFCWARGPECHRSRLIYPPPLSSCYAWSLNFPFLLFFLCFCSQIPPLILPRPPPFSSNFSMQPSHSFRAWYMQHTCHRVSSLWAYSNTRKYVMSDSLMTPNVMHSVHMHTWEHFWGYICIHCRSFSRAALALRHINWACTPSSI